MPHRDKAQRKAYRIVNKKKINEYGRAHYAKNKEEINARKKAYRIANKEKMSAQKKAYRIKNGEKIRAQERASSAANKEKNKPKMKAYYAAHRGDVLKKKYDITLEDYKGMFESQGGRCKICKRKSGKRMLAVDHNHKTHRVRALLCNNCNAGLGMFGDDLSLLLCAAAYLEEHN